MTREEVIRFLGQLQRILIDSNSWKSVKQVIRESFTMAIEALEALEADVPDTNVGDTISRQAAIDVAKEELDNGTFYDIPSKIESLPSAQPEPKRGKWIVHPEVKNVYGGTYIECSQCGEKYVVQHMEDEKYCRNCGARMEDKG